MHPVIKRLQKNGLVPYVDDANSLTWTFTDFVKKSGPSFYRKIALHHLVLDMEYSILRNQLQATLRSVNKKNKEIIKDELRAALMLSELLEHLYLNYLDVPREVKQLRQHQKIWREILADAGYTFSTNAPEPDSVPVGLSFSRLLGDTTINTNWYRLFFLRLKRVLDVIELFKSSSEAFRRFVFLMDKYTNPMIAHLGWIFYLPRLLTNLFVLLKHLLPGFWMSKEENSLAWYVRLLVHLQRRWFELGNDLAWVGVGLVNCFVLTGALAPVGLYIVLTFFAFDVAMAVIRAYIELNRLYSLQNEYKMMGKAEHSDEKKQAIKEYQNHINHRINFEIVRLGFSIVSTSAIFLATCLAIPAFAINPAIPLIGAVCLLTISLVTFVFIRLLDQYRPNDQVKKPSGVVSLGLFAKKEVEKKSVSDHQDLRSMPETKGYRC